MDAPLKGSDMDICVAVNEEHEKNMISFLIELQILLMKKCGDFIQVLEVIHAKVPILKMYDKVNG